MEDSQFVFGHAYLFYYDCHRQNLNRRGAYIHSLDRINNKKTAIYLINKKEKEMLSIPCNSRVKSEGIIKDWQRISKVKLFVNKCNWKGIKFPSEKRWLEKICK